MKTIIISPNTATLFSEVELSELHGIGEVIFIDKIKPLEEASELYEGDEERIVAIDPDFCDWKVSNEIIDKIPNLKALCLQTTSFSWVDVDYLKQKNVPVTNLRGFSSIAVAEWATTVVLSLARRLPLVIKDNWKLDYVNHRGQEVRGKTAGIIGLGNIGTALAENMQGLGMKVQYWSQNSVDERFTKNSLEELMATSDVILPAIASNSATKDLITETHIKSLKSTAIFVNVIHPIQHELILSMVQSSNLFGYGYEEEAGLKFGHHEGNIWNGPALGWCTDESMTKNASQWVKSIVDAANGKYPTQVNA